MTKEWFIFVPAPCPHLPGWMWLENNICTWDEFSLTFPGGSVVKNLSANAGDVGSISGWGSSPGEGNGNSLQCSYLGNPIDRGAWQATAHEAVEWDTAEHTHTYHCHPGFPRSSHFLPPSPFPASSSHPLPPFLPWWIISLWVSLSQEPDAVWGGCPPLTRTSYKHLHILPSGSAKPSPLQHMS